MIKFNNNEKPTNFDHIDGHGGITEQTEIYSGKRDDGEPLLNTKFDIQGLYDFLKNTLGLDKTHTHVQSTSATLWLIMHNLDKKPTVQIFDSSGNELHGEITHLNNNQSVIFFSTAVNGVAHLN